MGGSKMEFDLLQRSILSIFTTRIRAAELISGTCWQRSSSEHRALLFSSHYKKSTYYPDIMVNIGAN